MSSIDLVLLGMLYKESLSAYEMQKKIEYKNIACWVKISIPSIYKKVLQLEEKDYLTSELVKEGKMAEKAVYSMTPSGKDYFLKLIQKAATSKVSILPAFNAVIANLENLPKEQALVLVKEIQVSIESSIKSIEKLSVKYTELPLFKEKPPSQQMEISFLERQLIFQQTLLLNSIANWASDFILKYDEEN